MSRVYRSSLTPLVAGIYSTQSGVVASQHGAEIRGSKNRNLFVGTYNVWRFPRREENLKSLWA